MNTAAQMVTLLLAILAVLKNMQAKGLRIPQILIPPNPNSTSPESIGLDNLGFCACSKRKARRSVHYFLRSESSSLLSTRPKQIKASAKFILLYILCMHRNKGKQQKVQDLHSSGSI